MPNKKRIYQEIYRFVFRLVNTSYLYRTNTKLYQICAKTKYMNVIPSILFQIREGLKDCTIRIYHVFNRLVRALCYETIVLTIYISIDIVLVKVSRTPIIRCCVPSWFSLTFNFRSAIANHDILASVILPTSTCISLNSSSRKFV